MSLDASSGFKYRLSRFKGVLSECEHIWVINPRGLFPLPPRTAVNEIRDRELANWRLVVSIC